MIQLIWPIHLYIEKKSRTLKSILESDDNDWKAFCILFWNPVITPFNPNTKITLLKYCRCYYFFFILIHKKKSRDSLRKGEIIRVVGECNIRSLAKGPDIICRLEKGKGGEGDKFRFCYDKIYLIPPMRLCSIIIPPPPR